MVQKEKVEQNFISVVVYLKDSSTGKVLGRIDDLVVDRFERSEMVLCFDGPESQVSNNLREHVDSLKCPAITMVFMGRKQGVEAAMNAGVDAAVGDFVLEIDEPDSFDISFVMRSYQECMNGSDVVIGETPGRSLRGSLFYPVFNHFAASTYNLKTSSCSLVSRRAINRIRSISDYSPYRKAAYAASGLKVTGISAGGVSRGPKAANLGLAMDALALYTDAFYKIAFGYAVVMSAISFAELVYVVVIYLLGIPIGGWTTTMLAITFGFLGVFVALTFILKYVALSLRVQTNKQSYLIEGLRKYGR